ncbi:MAG: methyltransferase domain-containing protein [Candidatus Latescibacteria bacterium]|nr:methyltransferase domain-containing protein [Candidatus Latescibacterota bacterium]
MKNKLLIAQVCDLLKAEAQRQRECHSVEVPGLGRACIPYAFWPLIPTFAQVHEVDATALPSGVLERIRAGGVVVLRGDYTRATGILKYLDRLGKGVIDRDAFRDISNRFERSRQAQAAVRGALYRLTVIVRNGRMQGVTGGPFTGRRDLTPWLEGGADYPPDTPLLTPLRKILRIASDIKRLEDGVFLPALDAALVVFPTVFAPVDQKVVDLFAAYAEFGPGARVLDVGAGTGVLAFLAARRGARVVATDRNPEAVLNARLNARRLGLEDRVEVRGPDDLFDGVQGERFDHVLFNAPWLRGTPRTAYETALYDDGQVITRFLGGVSDHLEAGGRVWLLYADVFERTGDGALTRVGDLLDCNGLAIRRQWRTARAGRVSGRIENVVLYEIGER